MGREKGIAEAVRTYRVGIVLPKNDATKEVKERWKDLSEMCQEVTNGIHREWLVWHTQNNSQAKLRVWLKKLKERHAIEDANKKVQKKDRQPVPEKPPIPVQCVPKELSKQIYHNVSRGVDQIHLRPLTLMMQSTLSDLRTRKPANGSLHGWIMILLDRQGLPASTRGLPIPFDKQNAQLMPPEKRGGSYHMSLRLERRPVAGKKTAESIVDVIELYSGGKKRAQVHGFLEKLATGGVDFLGSNLICKDGKWYVDICYRRQIEEKPELDHNKVAFLVPGRTRPFWFCWRSGYEGGWKKSPHGSDGMDISEVRRGLLTQRWQRQQAYRYGGAMKGKGRKNLPFQKLKKMWRRFVHNRNHNTTINALRRCVNLGVDALVYWQPKAGKNKKFLSFTGKFEGHRDDTSWDWDQVKTMLNYKQPDFGVILMTPSEWVEYSRLRHHAGNGRQCELKTPRQWVEYARKQRKAGLPANEVRVVRKGDRDKGTQDRPAV